MDGMDALAAAEYYVRGGGKRVVDSQAHAGRFAPRCRRVKRVRHSLSRTRVCEGHLALLNTRVALSTRCADSEPRGAG